MTKTNSDLDTYIRIREEVSDLEAIEYRLEHVESLIELNELDVQNKESLIMILVYLQRHDDSAVSEVFTLLNKLTRNRIEEKKSSMETILKKGFDYQDEIERIRGKQ